MATALKQDIGRYRPGRPIVGELLTVGEIWTIFIHPGLFAIALHRFGGWIDRRYPLSTSRWRRRLFSVFYHLGRRLLGYWAKIEIWDGAEIGPGFYISDRGGVILGARRIGANCTIGHDVTVGLNVAGELPDLGNDVVIFPGSVVYGGITIADGVVIGERSVLSKSLPKRCCVQGNPARVVDGQRLTALSAMLRERTASEPVESVLGQADVHAS